MTADDKGILLVGGPLHGEWFPLRGARASFFTPKVEPYTVLTNPEANNLMDSCIEFVEHRYELTWVRGEYVYLWQDSM